MDDKNPKAKEKKIKDENPPAGGEKKKEEPEKKEGEEWKNKYLRVLADFQNFEKRIQQDKTYQANRVKLDVLLRLIPFLDDLEKASIFYTDPGLKMVKDNFMKTLSELGVKEMDLEGKEFDPHISEAIEVVEGEKDNIIAEVVRKGYMLGDQILRVGTVKVSKKNSKTN